jgi:hypothetical protein
VIQFVSLERVRVRIRRVSKARRRRTNFVMPDEMERLVRDLPCDRHAFQKNPQRMYDCRTLQISNRQQIMPDPEADVLLLPAWPEIGLSVQGRLFARRAIVQES